MPVLKVKKDGIWEKLGGTSPADGGNADMLDGRHASYFATASDVSDLKSKVGDESVSAQITAALDGFSSGKTLSEHLAEESMVLTSLQYGDALPVPGIPGRIFFLKASE